MKFANLLQMTKLFYGAEMILWADGLIKDWRNSGGGFWHKNCLSVVKSFN